MSPSQRRAKPSNPSVRRAPLALARLDHHGPRAVGEQDAGAAVGPVHQARHGVRADHQRTIGQAPRREPVRHRQRIDEARADRLHVEGDADRRAELSLHDGGGGGKGQVGRGGGDDDQVHLGGGASGGGQRLSGRLHGHVGGCAPRLQLAAFADAGPLPDPIVSGVDELGQILVGDYGFGEIAADAGDHAARYAHSEVSRAVGAPRRAAPSRSILRAASTA